MKPLQVNGGIEPVNLVDIFYFIFKPKSIIKRCTSFHKTIETEGVYRQIVYTPLVSFYLSF